MPTLARRFTLLMLALTAILALTLIYLLHYAEQRKEQEMRISAKLLIKRQQEQITVILREIHTDLLLLASSPYWMDLATVENTSLLEKRMTYFSRIKGRYEKIRFLDPFGMERMRVNYHQGNPVAVEQSGLQSKSHRYYFTEAIGIGTGNIYQSPLDLNMEHHQVEVPLKPVIRFATPVENHKGDLLGLIVLNYFGKQLLEEFRHATEGISGLSALLNSNGDFLSGFQREQEWGFMFDTHDSERFLDLYPQVWRSMNAKGFGSLRNGAGSFSFLKVEARQHTVPPRSWHIVHWVPADVFEAERERTLATLLPPFLLVALILSAALWLLLWNAERRRQSELASKQLRTAMQTERDAFVGGPTVIFKYQNRFGWPVDYVSPNVFQVLKLEAADFTSGKITYSSIIAPEFLRRFTDENLGALQQQAGGFERSQYKLVDGDGQHCWLQDFTSVIRDPEGRVTHFIGYINDITPLKQVQDKLTRSKEHARQLLDAIADPTLVIDPYNYKLELINQAARETYINGNIDSSPITCHQLSHASDQPCSGADEPCPIAMIRESRLPQSVIHRHYNAHGEPFYVEVSATPILNAEGRVVRIIESHRDITRHEEMKRQLKHLAETDLLTGTYNRLRFHAELSAAVHRARDLGLPLTVIMFDLDHFKQINDRYGHDAGDSVLKLTSKRVRSGIRQTTCWHAGAARSFSSCSETPQCKPAKGSPNTYAN